jgi:hypothetical protein
MNTKQAWSVAKLAKVHSIEVNPIPGAKDIIYVTSIYRDGHTRLLYTINKRGVISLQQKEIVP